MATMTPEQFAATDGVADWQAAPEGATATFATGSFAKGVEFVVEIGRLADAANHHPDVDLRYPSVALRLTTHDAGSTLTERDAALARQISEVARRLGIPVAAGGAGG